MMTCFLPFPLPVAVIRRLGIRLAAQARLKAAGSGPQTTCTMRNAVGFPASMMPKPSGRCRLLDGTVIFASGEKDVLATRSSRPSRSAVGISPSTPWEWRPCGSTRTANWKPWRPAQ